MIKVKVFRFNRLLDKEPVFKNYEVPLETGMSALNVLDYIYQNLDSSIAYYDHASCSLGICARCTGKVNSKPGLLCQIPVNDQEELILEPFKKDSVIKDLVIERKKRKGLS